jgi:hypothetical protein
VHRALARHGLVGSAGDNAAMESFFALLQRNVLYRLNEIACRVKLADLRQNLANNLRVPPTPGNAERIVRYERAVSRLSFPV